MQKNQHFNNNKNLEEMSIIGLTNLRGDNKLFLNHLVLIFLIFKEMTNFWKNQGKILLGKF